MPCNGEEGRRGRNMRKVYHQVGILILSCELHTIRSRGSTSVGFHYLPPLHPYLCLL